MQQHIKMIIHHKRDLSYECEWFNIRKSIIAIHHIHRRKLQKHIIISIDAKKAFDKIQYHFMMKKKLSEN